VVIPEQPPQDFVALGIGRAVEFAEGIGEPRQDRRHLRVSDAVDLQHRNLAHFVDAAPPFWCARDGARTR